jgi:hypothetical protein
MDQMTTRKEYPSSYSSRRREGMQELRFWVDERHRKALFTVLRELINRNDHEALVMGLEGLKENLAHLRRLLAEGDQE